MKRSRFGSKNVKKSPKQSNLHVKPQLLKISTKNELNSATCGPFLTKPLLLLVVQQVYWLGLFMY